MNDCHLIYTTSLISHYIFLFVFLLFTEGGRLQKELEYVEANLGVGAGATNELIIQTPSNAGSILTTDALLAHLEVIKAASQVVVEKEDV